MTTRRTFVAALLAGSACPTLGWADAGDPAWLAAAREPDGGYALFGMTATGEERFRIPLPDRGHAAAAHPHRPEAVAFARRPGTFALVLDCMNGTVMQRLDAVPGRHFYGHGCFSPDGKILFTTENDIDSGQGVIGLWSRARGYGRIGEIASGGIGPHDILRLAGTETLVVANGGIRTHPAHGRDKLNLDTMAPNLSYLSADGTILDRVTLAADLHHASIRHLAQGPGDAIAFAMQWQGDAGHPAPLLGLHRPGTSPILARAPEAEQIAMEGYAGSVAFDGAGGRVAITSPRGGRVHVFDAAGRFLAAHRRADVCGIGPAAEGFLATDGLGGVSTIGDALRGVALFQRAWDNHLVPI